MYIIRTIKDLYRQVKILKKTKNTIGLIPTMGSLHNGHLKLILLAKKYADIIIVTIFVNPMQFNCLLDFQSYPKDFQKDLNILKNTGNVTIIFTPSIHEIYPNGINNQTFIEVPILSNIIEGRSRPRHFHGVATIVAKFFNIIQPNFAFFGEKDYQQLLIIKQLVKELNYMIKIISLPIIRSKNGLALSSRNKNLTLKQKKIAPILYKTIKKTVQAIITENINNRKKIIDKAILYLTKKGFVVDIFNIYDRITLNLASQKSKKMIILAAAWLGKIRLIDNKKIF